jgi:hypothetical protein
LGNKISGNISVEAFEKSYLEKGVERMRGGRRYYQIT